MRRVICCSVVLIAAGLNLSAQEWTQWRGPSRNGQAQFTTPKTWPATLSAKWKVTVGEGYASPLMSDGRLLQFARQDDNEVAMALDPETGKILWQQRYPASWTPVNSAAKHGKGPKSTPLVYDGRFYTFGATGILSAWNAASGKLEWRRIRDRLQGHVSDVRDIHVAGGRRRHDRRARRDQRRWRHRRV